MLDNLTLFQTVFFIIAASSSIILIIQTVLAILGIGGGEGGIETGLAEGADGDIDVDVDSDSDVFERGQTSASDSGFRLFTVKGVMAFLMMGGWVGFMLSRSGAPEIMALACGVVSGFAALVMMAKTMQWLMGLQSDGTLKMKNTLGQTGQVYIKIPGREKGMGKVSVTVQERFCEFDAVTEETDDIKTGESVYVTDVRPGNVLVVEKSKND